MKDKPSFLTADTSAPHRYDTGARVPGSEEHEQHAAAEWTDIGALHEWTGNPRRNDDNVGAVAASIKRFGFAAPIVARANGEIIAGHTRFRAAHMLGLKRVPVRHLDLSPEEAHLLALADNKLTENTDWDDLALAQALSGYSLEDAALAGFDSVDLAKLGASILEDAKEQVEKHTCPECGQTLKE